MLMRKKFNSWWGSRGTVCVGFACSPYVCVDVSQRLRFPHTPQRWARLWMACLLCPKEGECGCVWVPCEGRVFRPGSCLVPRAAGKGSGAATKLEDNYLTCFYSSSLNVCIDHIYFHVFSIRYIWELYLEVYWCFGTKNILQELICSLYLFALAKMGFVIHHFA